MISLLTTNKMRINARSLLVTQALQEALWLYSKSLLGIDVTIVTGEIKDKCGVRKKDQCYINVNTPFHFRGYAGEENAYRIA